MVCQCWRAFGASSGFTELGAHLLDASDKEQMRDVFLSGRPWLVLCTRSVMTERQEEALADLKAVFHELGKRAKRLSVEKRFRAGILHCDDPLPSGKTIFQRFKIPSKRPLTAFLSVNGHLPVVVPLSLLARYKRVPKDKQKGKSKSKGKGKDKPPKSDSGQRKRKKTRGSMVKALLQFTAARSVLPSVFPVSTELNFRAQCLRKKKCALVLHRKRLSRAAERTLLQARVQFRTMQWATLNWTRYEFSLEKKLPSLLPEVPRNESAYRLMFFRQPTRLELYGNETEASSKPEMASSKGKKATKAKGKSAKDSKKKTKKKPKKKKKNIAIKAKVHRGGFDFDSLHAFLKHMDNSHLPPVGQSSNAPVLASMRSLPTIVNRNKEQRDRERKKKSKKEKRIKQVDRARRERRRKRQRKAEEEKAKADKLRKQKEREFKRREAMEREQAEAAPQFVEPSEEQQQRGDADSSNGGGEKAETAKQAPQPDTTRYFEDADAADAVDHGGPGGHRETSSELDLEDGEEVIDLDDDDNDEETKAGSAHGEKDEL